MNLLLHSFFPKYLHYYCFKYIEKYLPIITVVIKSMCSAEEGKEEEEEIMVFPLLIILCISVLYLLFIKKDMHVIFPRIKMHVLCEGGGERGGVGFEYFEYFFIIFILIKKDIHAILTQSKESEF